jgi:murein DD-endopeptidase MepM/ murein hydrolase activator NlpD
MASAPPRPPITPPVSASPSAPPSISPSATPTPTPSATPAAISEEALRIGGAPLEEMRHVIAATSLAERIDAERSLAAAERDLLIARMEKLRGEQAAATARSAEIAARLDEQRAVLERLLQQTYRVSQTSPLQALLQRWSVIDVVVHVDQMATLSEKQRETVEMIRSLEAEAQRVADKLAREEGELTSLSEAVAAKDATLAQLAARADRLVAAAARGPRAVSDAEIDLLRSLADDAAREHQAEDDAIAAIASASGVTLPTVERWQWPAAGIVSQGFGPTALEIEPAVTYRGTTYPHFHDAIDVAAPLGSPVRAAARGRVAFVGHLSGGAEVVILAHADGLITLYAHLDDTLAPPPVKVGDVVEAGQRIGAIGLTGVTTGPHLHFAVRRGSEAVDPLSVLPAEQPS